jgi:hypothetical protein
LFRCLVVLFRPSVISSSLFVFVAVIGEEGGRVRVAAGTFAVITPLGSLFPGGQRTHSRTPQQTRTRWFWLL